MRAVSAYLTALFLIIGLSAVSVSAQDTNIADNVILENKVEKQLRKLPYYGVFDFITFEVNDGTVTLNGKVRNAINRSHAKNYVKSIDGVSEVINNIDLLPASSFDDRIRRNTVRSFYSGAGLYRYIQGTNPSVRIIVDGGRLTLEGVVASNSDIRYANILARGIPGVFEVTNNLTIEKARP